MLSRQETQEERRGTLENDRRVREQGSTFSQFAESEASEPRGRFTTHSASTVIGSTPSPASQYPAAFQQHDPVPDEPSLGQDVNAMEPCGEKFEVERSLSLEPSSSFPAQRGSGCLQSQTPTPPASDTALPLAADGSSAGGLSSLKMFRRF
jgi:hypothetical protein